MTILDKLADHARERVAAAKETVSAQEIKERALALPKGELEFEYGYPQKSRYSRSSASAKRRRPQRA